ncbi:hypothetical protein Pmar_PMAR012466 [Perkinsus marinus ATCC 50983]|uniref:Uncharacterized protein n=1 Tax=Perkinsus marinus (strain ATCC 50983 / TXsc) TaxID=423536 RepID=C5K7F0_PERM5|nr:hypothetical protein Pmar_PMAR012466 [Perkinsus marinus ATCC 50983]EER19485.1 hypothetical protein Pmar_PMAR012466 [Perkinsus marinus ATCC 50983]|eukprot:XP_002787689.1 hypothetical protein Pmar_PMAR012466 [Perkinsus marinus ATCC 50983]
MTRGCFALRVTIEDALYPLPSFDSNSSEPEGEGSESEQEGTSPVSKRACPLSSSAAAATATVQYSVYGPMLGILGYAAARGEGGQEEEILWRVTVDVKVHTE